MTKPYSPTDLKRLHREWRRRRELTVRLILDGVQNPYNLGAIMRTAAAYRVDKIVMAPPLIELPHAKVAKTALGCERLVSVETVPTGVAGVEKARSDGFTTVAIELAPGAVPLFDLSLTGPICLVVGHEERGVKAETLDAVDHIAFLPLVGKVGSLNVAHSVTAALHETTRQLWAEPGSPASP